MSSKEPRKVHCVGYPRVHSITGVGHPDVRGVADQENAPAAKFVGNEAAADAVLELVVTEIRPDTEDGTD
jgi:hypothetical protein